MNGILGWADYPLPEPEQDFLTSDRAPIQRTQYPSHRLSSNRCGLMSCPANTERLLRHDGVLAVFAGQPRWVSGELSELHRSRGFALSLITAYREHGHDFLKRITGPFSLALVDENTCESVIAVDRMGIHGLRYSLSGNAFIFGSSLDMINAHPAARREIAPQSLLNYLFYHMLPAPTSIYQNEHQLVPGSYVHYRNGAAAVRNYWEMTFPVDARADTESLGVEFNALLRECVRNAMGDGKTGAFLSGGTDSSTVSGLLCELRGEPAHTYSIGFDADGYDETEYARIASKHFGTIHRELYLNPSDLVSAIPKIAAAYDQPFGNASAVPTYFCAGMAREDGMIRVLGGDGGDELFGGNARYAKQKRFAAYGAIPGFARKGIIEPLLLNIPGAGRIPLLGKASSYVRQARIPMPERLETYNLVTHFGVGNMFADDFLKAVDASQPAQLNRDIYGRAPTDDLVNRMLAFDFRLTLADSDLPKVTKMCELAGIEVGFPLLDDELVEFSGRISPDLKVRGNTLRYFFKHALKDFLPPEIIAKKKHGFGLPFGPWLGQDRELRDLTYGALSEFKSRRILRPAFIDMLLDSYIQQHASYYGTMIWLIMMLEQWFKHRAPEWRH